MEVSSAGTDILERIRVVYSILRTSEKKVADYIMANTNATVAMSIGELAEESGVSEATVTRFCRALEVGGFQDLKINIARRSMNPRDTLYKNINPENPASLPVRILNDICESLHDTTKTLDGKAVEMACEKILKASRIFIFGVGGSGALAIDMGHKFLKLGLPSIAVVDSHIQAMYASMCSDADVVIGISDSGETIDVVDALVLAKKQKAFVIGITNNIKSHLGKILDVALLTVGYTSPQMAATVSRFAAMMITDVLYLQLALNREVLIDNIRKTDLAVSRKKY